jgi:hypothetical protein
MYHPVTQFNFTLEDPVVIKGDSQCEYPDFLPVSHSVLPVILMS